MLHQLEINSPYLHNLKRNLCFCAERLWYDLDNIMLSACGKK